MMKLRLDIIVLPFHYRGWNDLPLRKKLELLADVGIEDCHYISGEDDAISIHGAELSESIKQLTIGELLVQNGDVAAALKAANSEN